MFTIKLTSGGLCFSVDLPHHLRGLFVTLSVDVPQHKGRSSPGKLLRKESPETASSTGNNTHLALHTLLPWRNKPFSTGQYERPHYFKSDHE